MEPEDESVPANVEPATIYFNWMTCKVIRGYTLIHGSAVTDLELEMGFWMKVHLN